MNHKVFRLLIMLSFLIAGLSSCNKPYTPPEIVGTWTLNSAEVYFGLIFNIETYESFPQSLKDKIQQSPQLMEDVLKELKTITILENNTFTLTHASGQKSSGTYTQDNQYINFTFSPDYYPNANEWQAIAEDKSLWLYPNYQYIKSLFITLTGLDNVESDLVFNENNRTQIQINIPYKLSNY